MATRRQSEAGCIGEESPNVDLVQAIACLLKDDFKHVHGGITNNDCAFFISQTRLGTSVNKTEGVFIACGTSMGCHEDLGYLIKMHLKKEQDLIPVFQEAILNAIIEIENGER